jgi:hypothetical protein
MGEVFDFEFAGEDEIDLSAWTKRPGPPNRQVERIGDRDGWRCGICR